MAEINKVSSPQPQGLSEAQNGPQAAPKSFWPVIGKAWINKGRKGQEYINMVFGNQSAPFESITVKNGDKLYLRVNTKRPGIKDADFQVLLPTA